MCYSSLSQPNTPAKAEAGSLLLHSASPRLPNVKTGGLTNGIGDRSADDQMTERRKLFKTLITPLMLGYTFGCFLGRAPNQKGTGGSLVLCRQWIRTHSLTPLPRALPLTIQKQKILHPRDVCNSHAREVSLRDESQRPFTVDFAPVCRCAFLLRPRGKRCSSR